MSETSKYQRRRLRTSYLSTVISISLVLFMLGLFGFLIINAKRISDNVKENIGFEVILKEDVKEVDVLQLQKELDATDYVKSTMFVPKEVAAKDLQQKLGEDFISFLGYNPLSSSVEVKLKADYAQPDSVAWIEKEIIQNNIVKEVFYEKSLVELVNDNVKKISLVIIAFSSLLLIISIALINNTIRLSIYSRRFTIKTMQLVGATPGFISKPFIFRGIRHGIYSGLLATLLLSGLLYLLYQQIPELFMLQDLELFAFLGATIIVAGIIISGLSTLFAVSKFLRLKQDDLYY